MSLFSSLLLVIAGSTQRELARQVRYLKTENEILRSKLPTRISITAKERQRLVKFGAKLGKALRQLVSIVTLDTFLRWIREEKTSGKRKTKAAKRGRPRTKEEIRALVIKFAKENTWGYLRIVGELKKLGIFSMKKSTVRNILKQEGLDPCPKRSGATWDEFITRHAASLWQADFFSQKVLTTKGIREAFVLVFLNVDTRRVVATPATFNPDAAWVTEQTEAFVQQARTSGLRIRYVQHDRDGKYGDVFDATLKKAPAEGVKGPAKSPNTQAYVERFIGSIRSECLNHFILFGLKHLDSVLASWISHYLTERPHQGTDIGNELLVPPAGKKKRAKMTDVETLSLGDIRCHQRLGGLLKHYERKAA